MPTLEELGLRVAGCRPDDADALIYRICGTEWATAEERYAAQALVIRLERLKWRGGAGYDGPALPSDGRRPRRGKHPRPTPTPSGAG